MPWIFRERVSIGKDVVFAGTNNLSVNCCLAATLASYNKRLSMGNGFAVSLVILKCLVKQIVAVGVRPAEVLDVHKCVHICSTFTGLTEKVFSRSANLDMPKI